MALKVLTVDDSKTIRMIVKKAFRPYDCELYEAENGSEGLEAAGSVKPDLIVLDITMPIMNGIEMLGKLKSDPALKKIPVIMLTAESGKDNVMQIVKMGVKDYMVKPFKGEQLIERAIKLVSLEPKEKEKPSDDPSKKYFSMNGDIQHLALPQQITRPITVEIDKSLQARIKDMLSSGINKLILDLGRVTQINVSLIRLIMSIIQNCEKSKIRFRVVCTSAMTDELKGFQETSELPIHHTVEEAAAAL
ncbi:MAG: response regulator [Deltaproteobacteria bacterium]|nr:response regulator [Deltaproteobacteria bacterium]